MGKRAMRPRSLTALMGVDRAEISGRYEFSGLLVQALSLLALMEFADEGLI